MARYKCIHYYYYYYYYYTLTHTVAWICRKTSCARYAPPMYAARCRPAPAHIHASRLACGAHHALLPVAVGAINIHDVRDRQTDVRRASSLNAPLDGA